MRVNVFIAWMVLVCLCTSPAVSQDLQADYTPQWNFNASRQNIIDLRKRFLSWVPKAGITNTEARRHFFQSTLDKSQLMHKLDSMNMLMATDTMTRLLNHLVDHILQHNPSIDSADFTLFTFRDYEGNAYNLGEGIIFFNVALLERLTSVDQVAFILAHEMAHDLEKHVFNNAVAHSRKIYEEVFNADSLNTKRKRALRLSSLESILDKFNAERLQFRRDMELEADSIGFVLATNAGFDSEQAFEMIGAAVMEHDVTYTDSLPLTSIFSFDEIPFQPHWLVPQDLHPNWEIDSSLFETPDSLSTHPVWSTRIEKLRQLPDNKAGEGIDFPYADAFNKQLREMPFEALAALVQAGNFTMALLNGLHLHLQYPDNVFVNAVIAHSLLEIGHAAKKGNFLSLVTLPDIRRPEPVNDFLHFLHNLRSDDYLALHDAYKTRYLGGHATHPYVAFLNEIAGKYLTQQEADAYHVKYSHPYYTMLVKQRTLIEPGKK